MDIIRIKGDTYCIDTPFCYIPFYKLNENDIIMLDTGWAGYEQQGLSTIIEENNFIVKGIISSHAHIDHMGNNGFFKNKYGSVVAMTEIGSWICQSAFNVKTLYNHCSMGAIKRNDFSSIICKADIKIKEEDDSVIICGKKFGIVKTPGHSPEHISIVTPDNVFYAGDAFLSKDAMASSKIPYHFVIDTAIETTQKLKSCKYPVYIMAHKGTCSISELNDILDFNISELNDRLDRIYNISKSEISKKGPRTKDELIIAVVRQMKIKINSEDRFLDIYEMIVSYLQNLEDNGRLDIIYKDNWAYYC